MGTVQLTIDFLLKEKIDNYFCLEWETREEPEVYPFFSNVKIPGNNFSYNFLNKLTHLPIMMSGKIKIRNKDKFLITLDIPEQPQQYTNIHFLKSHLQKCIRRKQHSRAIQTARHLIDIDPIQFLRRLAIIFVEDVMLTKHFSVLIWLLVAVSGNKLKLQLNHIEWLLGLVYIACLCPWKDAYDIPEEFHLYSNEKYAKYILDSIKDIPDKSHQAIIHALLIRASFGGMSGDLRLLLDAAFIWIRRFTGDDRRWEEHFNTQMRSISGSVLPLEKRDWILSAIDFHCFPKMLIWIKESNEEYEEDEIKHLIWHFSSKLNYREWYEYNGDKYIPTNEEKERWKIIEKQVKSIGKYCITNFS